MIFNNNCAARSAETGPTDLRRRPEREERTRLGLTDMRHATTPNYNSKYREIRRDTELGNEMRNAYRNQMMRTHIVLRGERPGEAAARNPLKRFDFKILRRRRRMQ